MSEVSTKCVKCLAKDARDLLEMSVSLGAPVRMIEASLPLMRSTVRSSRRQAKRREHVPFSELKRTG